jgi:DNA-binding winged helix-turn-helix (wHTH) protein/tetratricopeptide (TPR) repeat protein
MQQMRNSTFGAAPPCGDAVAVDQLRNSTSLRVSEGWASTRSENLRHGTSLRASSCRSHPPSAILRHAADRTSGKGATPLRGRGRGRGERASARSLLAAATTTRCRREIEECAVVVAREVRIELLEEPLSRPLAALDHAEHHRAHDDLSPSVATSSMYRDSFRRWRCLIPADGLYEWRQLGPPAGARSQISEGRVLDHKRGSRAVRLRRPTACGERSPRIPWLLSCPIITAPASTTDSSSRPLAKSGGSVDHCGSDNLAWRWASLRFFGRATRRAPVRISARVSRSGDVVAKATRTFRFGEFELDEQQQELRKAGALVPLHATPMRLLVHLLEHRARLLSKEDLLEAVWPDVVVSDTALSTALKEIRGALGDDGARQRWIRTQRGRGYQFLGEVEAGPGLPARLPMGGFYGVPRGLSMFFVGRSQALLDLEEALTKNTYVSVQASVEGLAGIGKTELALQLVHRLAHEKRFPGGIFWLDAEDADLRMTWGSTIAEQCRVAGSSVDERCQELLRQLQERKEPTLVILDNVASWSSTQRPAPLPVGPHIRLIVTTRTKNLGGAHFQHLNADFLAAPSSRELIVRLAGRDPNPGLDELLGDLGGHTLAIELAGVFLATYASESAQSYRELLRQKSDEVEAEVSDRVRYEATVTHAFRTVWMRLDEPLQEAWQLAACFEPESASRELAEAVGVTANRLRALEALHLIRCDRDGRWSMHRLTQAFGRAMAIGSGQIEAAQRFFKGCVAYTRTIDGDNWPAFVRDRVHFGAAIAAAEHFPEQLKSLIELKFRVASLLDGLGDVTTSQVLLRQVDDSCRKALESGASKFDQLFFYQWLAFALSKLTDSRRDMKTSEQAVAAIREVVRRIDRASQPQEWAEARVVLGFSLRRVGDDRRDAALLEQSVEAHREALEVLRPQEGLAAWIRGALYLASSLMSLGRITGRYEWLIEAEALNRSILETCSREDSPPRWARAQYRLALTLMSKGERIAELSELREAVHRFKLALEEWTYARFPREWTFVHHEIARALLMIGRAMNDPATLHAALGAIRQALSTLSQGQRPDDWADAQTVHRAILDALSAATERSHLGSTC